MCWVSDSSILQAFLPDTAETQTHDHALVVNCECPQSPQEACLYIIYIQLLVIDHSVEGCCTDSDIEHLHCAWCILKGAFWSAMDLLMAILAANESLNVTLASRCADQYYD